MSRSPVSGAQVGSNLSTVGRGGMNPIVRSALALSLGLAGSFVSSEARAQVAGRLALDVQQGVYAGPPGAPFTFSGELVPALDIGRLRLGVDVGAVLENPKWALVAGFQPSLVLVPVLTSSTGLRLVADGQYVTQQKSWRATGGLVVDLESVHFGVVSGYDSLHDAALILSTVGVDLPTFFGFLAEKPL